MADRDHARTPGDLVRAARQAGIAGAWLIVDAGGLQEAGGGGDLGTIVGAQVVQCVVLGLLVEARAEWFVDCSGIAHGDYRDAIRLIRAPRTFHYWHGSWREHRR